MLKKLRARDIGIPLKGLTGKNNNITDVEGVEVGYSTIIRGEPEDYTSYGSSIARTGVTAILPRGRACTTVLAACSSHNGYGELTGAHYIRDFGRFDGPIMLTNTFSLGTVRDAAYKYFAQHDLISPLTLFGEPVEGATLMYPIVGETYDGVLNNCHGFHVKEEHVFEAIEAAESGPIDEGNVGGGTGMQCHLFKGGSGSSSRQLSKEQGGYTVGIFAQCNHGYRERFIIKGRPVGELVKDCDPVLNGVAPGGGLTPKPGTGSIIVVVATDAPVESRQLEMMLKRVPIGIGLLGGGTEIHSGEIWVGFTTAHTPDQLTTADEVQSLDVLPWDMIDPLFAAVVDATEEAVLNAMVAAETMTGINGNTFYALPHDQLNALF